MCNTRKWSRNTSAYRTWRRYTIIGQYWVSSNTQSAQSASIGVNRHQSVGMKIADYSRLPQTTADKAGLRYPYQAEYRRLSQTVIDHTEKLPQTEMDHTADHRIRLRNIPQTITICSYHIVARRLHHLKLTQINNSFKNV